MISLFPYIALDKMSGYVLVRAMADTPSPDQGPSREAGRRRPNATHRRHGANRAPVPFPRLSEAPSNSFTPTHRAPGLRTRHAVVNADCPSSSKLSTSPPSELRQISRFAFPIVGKAPRPMTIHPSNIRAATGLHGGNLVRFDLPVLGLQRGVCPGPSTPTVHDPPVESRRGWQVQRRFRELALPRFVGQEGRARMVQRSMSKKSQQKPKKQQRRNHTREYKAEVVRLCHNSGKSPEAIGREMGVAGSLVRGWIRQANVDAGGGEKGVLTTTEREELAQQGTTETPSRIHG